MLERSIPCRYSSTTAMMGTAGGNISDRTREAHGFADTLGVRAVNVTNDATRLVAITTASTETSRFICRSVGIPIVLVGRAGATIAAKTTASRTVAPPASQTRRRATAARIASVTGAMMAWPGWNSQCGQS